MAKKTAGAYLHDVDVLHIEKQLGAVGFKSTAPIPLWKLSKSGEVLHKLGEVILLRRKVGDDDAFYLVFESEDAGMPPQPFMLGEDAAVAQMLRQADIPTDGFTAIIREHFGKG